MPNEFRVSHERIGQVVAAEMPDNISEAQANELRIMAFSLGTKIAEFAGVEDPYSLEAQEIDLLSRIRENN